MIFQKFVLVRERVRVDRDRYCVGHKGSVFMLPPGLDNGRGSMDMELTLARKVL